MRPSLVGHAVDLATTHHLPQRRPNPSRRLPGPARPTQPRSPGSDEPVVDTASTPTPAIPATRLPAPPRPSTTSPGRTQRTRERTDTGHPDAQTPHRTLDTIRVDRHAWRLDVRTGHWTPLAEDVDTLTKARPASAPPGPPRPAAARWATQRCSCGQRLRRLATMTARRWGHLPARDCLLPCRVAARSLRRLSRASAHCSPRTISGRA
jgi:hypothetical protein